MRAFIIFNISIISTLCFCGCHSKQSQITQQYATSSYVYSPTQDNSVPTEASVYSPSKKSINTLSAGYLIKLICFDDDNISGEYRLNEKGEITLAYGVIAKLSGLTDEEASQELQNKFKPYFRKAPSISIQIQERKVYVKAQGLVNKPGTYLINETAGLDELIAESQGLINSNDASSVARYAKIQSADNQIFNIRLTEFFSTGSKPVTNWIGSETVFFQSDMPTFSKSTGVDSRYVNVLGQVRVPGEYTFKQDTNFFYYLVQAGGPTDRADTSQILLITPDSSKAGMKVTKLSMQELEKSPQINGGDVLFVQADNPSDFQKDAGVLGSLGGFLGSIATGVLAGAAL